MINKFIDRISPFIVMDILAKARTMPDVIHMEVGEPDLPPSEKVTAAYIRAVRDGKSHYTPAKGLMELREKIAGHYHRKYGVTLSPERIIVTPGTSGAFMVIFAIVTDGGRRLLLSDPSYPCYKNFALFLKTEPLFAGIGPDTQYEMVPDALVPKADIGAVVVSSPANPVGNLYRPETMEGLIARAAARGCFFVSDEIYHGLVYDRREQSALEFSDDVIVVNGFSKSFCMPGYRLGWMVLPDNMVRTAEIIIQNIFIAASTPAQYAALEAFDDAYLTSVRETFRERRDFLYGELKGLVTIDAVPDGAFYIWADISRFGKDSMEFCRELLEKKSVAVTPGIDFGSNRTGNYVRFAYTQDMARLREGVARIREFLDSLKQ